MKSGRVAGVMFRKKCGAVRYSAIREDHICVCKKWEGHDDLHFCRCGVMFRKKKDVNPILSGVCNVGEQDKTGICLRLY